MIIIKVRDQLVAVTERSSWKHISLKIRQNPLKAPMEISCFDEFTRYSEQKALHR